MFKFGDDGDKQLAEALNNYLYCEGHEDNRGCYIAPSCDVCEMHRSMEAEHIKETLAKLGYRKASDVARGIFEEIERAFFKHYDEQVTYSSPTLPYHIRDILGFSLNVLFAEIEKLKKKYESEGAESDG